MEDTTADDEGPTARAERATAIAAMVADGGFEADFFEQVVEEVGVGVGVYDESGYFTYVNDAYAEALGTDRETLLDRAVWDVNPTVDEDRFPDYWASFDVGETRQTETVHRTADGDEFPVETYTTAIEAGGTRYHVGTISDVTERVRGFEELKRQDQRLEEFASVVSHDLRNPLNVAMGRLQIVEEDCESEHIESIEDALLRMEDLIDDTLTLAREGSRLTDPDRVDLRQAVSTAWSTSGDPEATLEVETDEMGHVESDESRLCEILENLIRNAVDHAGPEVTVTVGRLEDGFYVADDGPGIPEEDREQIFDYGYSTHEGNTGFGLAIVEQIAAAHDWTVEVTESADGGARFEIRGVEFV